MRLPASRALLGARPFVFSRRVPFPVFAQRANSTQSTQPASPAAPYNPAQSEFPSPPSKPQEPVNIYKVFGRPFAKVFLMAMLSYQVFYWCWETMRIDEIEEEKMGEVKELEAKVVEYKKAKEGKTS